VDLWGEMGIKYDVVTVFRDPKSAYEPKHVERSRMVLLMCKMGRPVYFSQK
jgi:hypothetical protein